MMRAIRALLVSIFAGAAMFPAVASAAEQVDLLLVLAAMPPPSLIRAYLTPFGQAATAALE
jgi:hypothetical protein